VRNVPDDVKKDAHVAVDEFMPGGRLSFEAPVEQSSIQIGKGHESGSSNEFRTFSSLTGSPSVTKLTELSFIVRGRAAVSWTDFAVGAAFNPYRELRAGLSGRRASAPPPISPDFPLIGI
jgi:hypothetical protein